MPKEYKFSRLNEFTIAAILREYSNLTYLGRNVFVKSGSSSSKRQYINDVIITILEEFQRPMHHREIMPIVKKIRSVDLDMQIHPNNSIEAMGNNYYKLSYWDQELKIDKRKIKYETNNINKIDKIIKISSSWKQMRGIE